MIIIRAVLAGVSASVLILTAALGQSTLWDGIYSREQAERGEKVHSAACVQCHGERLNGAGQPDMPPSPAIARTSFLKKWSGKTVGDLFEYVRTQMPPDNPGRLSEQDTADAIAHMWAVSNLPAGQKEMPLDRKGLNAIVIRSEPN